MSGQNVEVHADRTIQPGGPCPDPILEMMYNNGRYPEQKMFGSNETLPSFSTDSPKYYNNGQACGAD